MATHRFPALLAFALLATTAVVHPASDAKPGVDWPSFRGIDANGISEGYPTATTWDIAGKKNVQWSIAVPGLGNSSPVIWGNKLCITTAISGKVDAGIKIGLYGDIVSVADNTQHTWKLLCYDKTSGKTLVDKTVLTGIPKIKRHTKSTHASSTLATDGSHLVAMFGSEGLYAFDMNGAQLWKKDLGVLDSGFYMVPDAQWEFGSSPIIHDGTVILQADVQKNSFLAAFDVATGQEKWRTPRQDVPTWSTPAIHQVNGQTQILVNGWKQTAAYDFATGKLIWSLNGGGDIPVPTPITGKGFVFITNAHGASSPTYAIRETAKGDISLKAGETTSDGVAWSTPRDGSYMATPLLYKDQLYVCRWNGVYVVYNATTGEKLNQGRLGTGGSAFTASPVAADGKIYSPAKKATSTSSRPARTRRWPPTRSEPSPWPRRRSRKEFCTSEHRRGYWRSSRALLGQRAEVGSELLSYLCPLPSALTRVRSTALLPCAHAPDSPRLTT